MDTNSNYALTSLYHHSGAKVSIPIDLDNGFSPERASNLVISIDALISAGLSVNAPGLVQGELYEEINAVAKRAGNDGVPIVAFYSSHPKLVKKYLHVYMDTVEDIEAFEKATGVKLASLPLNDGEKDFDRDKPAAKKYVISLPRPIKVVWKVSERWEKWKAENGEGQEPQKRILVRYEGGAPASEAKPAPKPETVKADPETGELPEDQPKQYKKMDGAFVQMLIKETGLAPTVIMPILAKVNGDTISLESAVKIINSNKPEAN